MRVGSESQDAFEVNNRTLDMGSKSIQSNTQSLIQFNPSQSTKHAVGARMNPIKS
ncbi:hypothetical protein C1H46_039341 [Malus baccata]|uniref:Uncharacterized protein n=1 Tax=Malus baccata TaxID=106549 RepID=A0A540KLM9_MALBA|nr:hypothetical protein C1H46_039341 [Malus baccata]